MKVKEVLELISSLVMHEINVYDVKANKDFTCDFAKETDVQNCIDQFGERTIMEHSVVFGEHKDGTPFFHFIVE